MCICADLRSLPARGAWIEIMKEKVIDQTAASLPARGAWIEIQIFEQQDDAFKVAPRTGSVD